MSDNSYSTARPGLPILALGTAVLAAERLRQLASQMQDQIGNAVAARPAAAPPPADRPTATDSTSPRAMFDPVHPSPADRVMNASLSAEPAWLNDADADTDTDRSATTVVGLTSQSVDFMRNTRNRVFDSTRELGDRFSASVTSTVNAPIDRVRDAVSNASAQGRGFIAASRDAAARTLRGAMDDSITWAGTNLVPRVIDNMMPYLVTNVVPRIIDGAMPQIRAKVIPVVINDLTADPRIRELVTAQSRGLLGDAADELRNTSSSADDAVEDGFRKLFHLTSDSDR